MLIINYIYFAVVVKSISICLQAWKAANFIFIYFLFFFCQGWFICIEHYENSEKGKKDFFFFFFKFCVDWFQQNFIVHPQQK